MLLDLLWLLLAVRQREERAALSNGAQRSNTKSHVTNACGELPLRSKLTNTIVAFKRRKVHCGGSFLEHLQKRVSVLEVQAPAAIVDE
jgi:hypothetical protein